MRKGVKTRVFLAQIASLTKGCFLVLIASLIKGCFLAQPFPNCFADKRLFFGPTFS